jgi:CHAD domain-containing protein
MRWDTDASPSRNAGMVLPQTARDWFESGQRAAADTVSDKALHEFRLATKHFRYTLELFRPVYGPGLEDRLERLKQVQTSLGDLHDCVIAADYIADAVKNKTARAAVERHLASCALRRRARFLRLWRTNFSPPDECERWVRYLSRPKELAGNAARRKSPGRLHPSSPGDGLSQ